MVDVAKTRVLVVEDSATVRDHLCEALRSDPGIEVVGEAGDGKQAIELCQTLRPDVVTMDMMLPVMSGLSATEYMMAYCPTPILVVSSSTNRGELFKTYDALAAGAVDVLEKPTGEEPEGEWEKKFISSVKMAARIRVITHPRARLEHNVNREVSRVAPRPDRGEARRGSHSLVAIGASTGGPGAIVEILQALPPAFSLPILFVLHISAPFSLGFAEWLDGLVDREVGYAYDGQPVGSAVGQVVMAPPDHHLVVRDSKLRLTGDPERHSCRPSVDVLFESVAQEYGAGAIACLLTGMGRDGAAGLLAVRRRGGVTIAQDEATSVVYGMPREAVMLDAADHILALGDIADMLLRLTGIDEMRR